MKYFIEAGTEVLCIPYMERRKTERDVCFDEDDFARHSRPSEIDYPWELRVWVVFKLPDECRPYKFIEVARDLVKRIP